MHLWNDYEGKTIAEVYPLGQLLRPEGRSAFFATSNGTGKPAMIRLTEALNDEHEMLERWRQVSELNQENLVAIRKFGQTSFEGTPLAYALMELTDANLGDILKERPLTPTETREVATSLVAALTALHGKGLIHEHIEPANVMAAGEVIKLRSDCVRECVADPEVTSESEIREQCDALRQKDVHDLAALLLRCLTLERTPHPGIKLPAPFDRIVAHGLDGTWGLAQIGNLLTPPAPVVPKAPVAPAVPAQMTTAPLPFPVAPGQTASSGPAGAVAAPASRVPSANANQVSANNPNGARVSPGVPQGVAPGVPQGMSRPTPSRPLVPDSVLATAAAQPMRHTRDAARANAAQFAPAEGEELPLIESRRIRTPIEPAPRGRGFWAACGAAGLMALFLIWHFFTGHSPVSKPVSAPVAVATPTIDDAPNPAPTPAPAPAPVAATSSRVATAQTQGGWHVVAYTYNREDQAFGKVASIREQHPSLRPEVFSPNGRAPYFVALGGGMSEDEAETLRNRARRSGMPRDTFIRKYSRR